MIFPRLWHRILGRLHDGEAPTWLRESREQVAREFLTTELRSAVMGTQAPWKGPWTRACAYVLELGPGAGGEYGAAYMRYLTEPGASEPTLPRGLTPWRGEHIRTVLDAYVTEHRWRA